MKKLSVVIPTNQRSQAVKKLLRSLDEQIFDFREMDAIIVSNFEDSELRGVLENINLKNFKVSLFVANKPGANASRNLGIKKSESKYIYLIDDDCYLNEATTLNKLLQLHEHYGDVGVIGGGYKLSQNASIEERAYNLISKEWQYIHNLGNNSSTRLVGGNVSYKKSFLDQSKELFDEEIHYGGSESEFHKRLSNKNIKMMYVPDFLINHESKLNQADIVNKARKQALAHAKFSIDGGGYVEQRKTYQINSSLWALKLSKNHTEYNSLIDLIELYNWTYHFVVKKPQISSLNLRWKSFQWMKKRRISASAGRI